MSKNNRVTFQWHEDRAQLGTAMKTTESVGGSNLRSLLPDWVLQFPLLDSIRQVRHGTATRTALVIRVAFELLPANPNRDVPSHRIWLQQPGKLPGRTATLSTSARNIHFQPFESQLLLTCNWNLKPDTHGLQPEKDIGLLGEARTAESRDGSRLNW